MNRKNMDLYLCKNDKDNQVMLFVKVDGNIKIKVDKENNENNLLNSLLTTSLFMNRVNLFTNGIELDSEQIKKIHSLPNLSYIKDNNTHPESFRSFIDQLNNEKAKKSYCSISINNFDYNNFHFIAFEVKTNTLQKTIVKHIKKKVSTDARIATNLLKDIIPKYMDDLDNTIPISIKSSNKDMLKSIAKILSDNKYDYLTKCIEGYYTSSFNVDAIIDNNRNEIISLIKSYDHSIKVKNEVSIDYDEATNKNKILIYTDATVRVDKNKKINNSALGVIIKQDGSDEIMGIINKKLKPKWNDIFEINDSEAVAIISALSFIKNKEWIDSQTIIEVRSDNLSNIRKLNGLENDSVMTKNIRDYCKKELEDIEISFKWVKGHSSNIYNIMADELAFKSLFNQDYNLHFEIYNENVDVYKKRNHNKIKFRP